MASAEQRFVSDKSRVLGKSDLSRKGSVDEPIKSLVDFINSQPIYYTTSSCSGRVVVFEEVQQQNQVECSFELSAVFFFVIGK